MKVLTGIDETREAVQQEQRQGRTVGFVPTMGALHAGHRSLIVAARSDCDVVVVSIFVNPTQFSPGEDFERYPRPLETDLAICREEGVDLVFAPPVNAMYPPDAATRVHVDGLTAGLCGAHRPGHFDGVTTVVTKLFHVVPADAAYFGEKDYQQLQVVRRMVRDLDIPITIVPCPTVRDAEGLAVSSRNAYLSEPQRQQATSLSQAMRRAIARFESGERDVKALVTGMESDILAAGPAQIDYVRIVDAETLVELDAIRRPARICLAVRIGGCRLIDNMPLGT